ncbi:MAG: MFS transporter, partial [Tumebacillaceae bacterium]
IACESEACRTSQGKIGFGFLFKDFNLLLLLIGSVAVSLGNNQMDSYLPLYLKDLLPQAAWLYGAMLSMNGILCVLLSMPMANYLGRYNPYSVMQISGGVYAVGMLLIAMSQSVAGMFAGYFVLTIGELFQSSVWRKLLADLAPADMRARYMGAGSIAWIVAGTLGPLSGGQLMKYYGGHVMFLIFTVVMASSLIFYRLLYLRRLKEQRKAASDEEKFPIAM